jgi:hypothetical protein
LHPLSGPPDPAVHDALGGATSARVESIGNDTHWRYFILSTQRVAFSGSRQYKQKTAKNLQVFSPS